MSMGAPPCSCESPIRTGICQLHGSLGKRAWDLLQQSCDAWREKAEVSTPPALDAEDRERLLKWADEIEEAWTPSPSEADQERIDLLRRLASHQPESRTDGELRCKQCGKRPYSTLTDQCPHCGAENYGQPESQQERCGNAHRYVEGEKQPCPDCQPLQEGRGERQFSRDELLSEEFQYAVAEEIVRLRAHQRDPEADPPEEVPEGDPLFIEIDHGLRAALDLQGEEGR